MSKTLHRFADRVHAGRYVARSLGSYTDRGDVVILALPRGGVPVAAEVARALGVPLDVLMVRKLGVPGHEEMAMGAIASGGALIINEVQTLDVDPEDMKRIIAREQAEIDRQEFLFRTGRPRIELRGKTVILMDDGLATGSTMRAAVKSVRESGAAHVIVAAPVGSVEACRSLHTVADEVVCPLQPPSLRSISEWYKDFPQTTDAEVQALLHEA